MPDRSKPFCCTFPEIKVDPGPPPGIESIPKLFVLSRCHCGVIRKVIGKYEGFCQIGESRSFPSWYPLSRNTWPKLLSSGHAVWHAEHGRPYFLAKAGIALTWTLGAGAAWAVELPR